MEKLLAIKRQASLRAKASGNNDDDDDGDDGDNLSKSDCVSSGKGS